MNPNKPADKKPFSFQRSGNVSLVNGTLTTTPSMIKQVVASPPPIGGKPEEFYVVINGSLQTRKFLIAEAGE